MMVLQHSSVGNLYFGMTYYHCKDICTELICNTITHTYMYVSLYFVASHY